MHYLTGSRALNFWYDEHPIKDETDWDIVVDTQEGLSGVADIAPLDIPSYEVCKAYDNYTHIIQSPVGRVRVASPMALMLLKRSHLHRPLKFSTHIRQYHFLKDKLEALIDEKYFKLLELQTTATKNKFGDKTPKLNKTKAEFFDDFVTKKYEHDDIHYATCYGTEPVYERLKTDDAKVWCSKKLWDKLDFVDQIHCVREEAFVIAIERWLIPKAGKYPARFAFANAVERICTTLCSGWFRDFAIENWPTVMDCSDYNFVEKFENAGFRIG